MDGNGRQAAAPVTSREVARGAGLAGLARLGAVIELVAQPLFIWLFGLATYGLYVVLWAAVSLATNLIDLAMTSALQRVVPAEEDEARAHGAVKLALLATVLPAALVALLVTLNAGAVADLFAAAPEDRARLPGAVALFVWALPLWTFIEVATSAARARRAFGPEIRLRIFWEQAARIVFACLFFAAGLESTGLIAAHLASLGLTALLCLPLLGRYYDLRLLARAPMPAGLVRLVIGTGLALLPSNLARRLLIDAPPLVLNLMLTGSRGAEAAGLFEIARKISTVPHIVRQAFQYVLAPLSSAQARSDRSLIAPIYRFSVRISAALVLPLAGLLIFAGRDVLSIYRPEAMATLPLLIVLVAARAVEAVVGPAQAIVEMTGHRGLPLLNSLIAAGVWGSLSLLLVEPMGPMGMAIAVGAGIVAASWAAAVEIRIMPFDAHLVRGFAVSAIGIAAMAGVVAVLGGPPRFVALHLVWAPTTWAALRVGLTRRDRQALGALSRRLRLV